jgi:hypothetical protein
VLREPALVLHLSTALAGAGKVMAAVAEGGGWDVLSAWEWAAGALCLLHLLACLVGGRGGRRDGGGVRMLSIGVAELISLLLIKDYSYGEGALVGYYVVAFAAADLTQFAFSWGIGGGLEGAAGRAKKED